MPLNEDIERIVIEEQAKQSFLELQKTFGFLQQEIRLLLHENQERWKIYGSAILMLYHLKFLGGKLPPIPLVQGEVWQYASWAYRQRISLGEFGPHPLVTDLREMASKEIQAFQGRFKSVGLNYPPWGNRATIYLMNGCGQADCPWMGNFWAPAAVEPSKETKFFPLGRLCWDR